MTSGMSTVASSFIIFDVVIVIVIDIAQALSSSCCWCGECAPRNATESEPLAQAEPLTDDGRIAGLPLTGEEGEEGLARDAERRRLAQAPHGSLLDLYNELDEILVESAERVNHKGRERCIHVFRIGIILEVLGSPSPLNGLAWRRRGAEMRRGKRVYSCQVDGHHFPRKDELNRAQVFGLEACQDAVGAREANQQLHAAVMAGGDRTPTHGRASKRMPGQRVFHTEDRQQAARTEAGTSQGANAWQRKTARP